MLHEIGGYKNNTSNTSRGEGYPVSKKALEKPGGGGGQLGLKHARMCVSKSEGNGSFFSIKGMK